jgi:hypothetical protein
MLDDNAIALFAFMYKTRKFSLVKCVVHKTFPRGPGTSLGAAREGTIQSAAAGERT